MRIQVKPISGEFAIDMDNGQRLYDRLVKALRESTDVVELDFEGVKVYATPFLNSAIGQLLRIFKAEELRSRLEFKNMADHGLSSVKRVVDSAKEYYTNEDLRRSIDRVQQKHAEDNQ
jgi:hypothetical protein